mmetsp:Transcript_17177/g.27759  ORF Transcript_17177/g.27759 Transcript_17177/m.27759 type:complete len:405 (-) Transcript_17177:2923-4137(-)
MKIFNIFAVCSTLAVATLGKELTLAEQGKEVFNEFNSLQVEGKAQVVEVAKLVGMDATQFGLEFSITNVLLLVINFINDFHDAVEKIGGGEVAYLKAIHVSQSVITVGTLHKQNVSDAIDGLLKATVHMLNTDLHVIVNDDIGAVIGAVSPYLGAITKAFQDIKGIISSIKAFFQAPKNRMLIDKVVDVAARIENKNFACAVSSAAELVQMTAELGHAELDELKQLAEMLEASTPSGELDLTKMDQFLRTQVIPGAKSLGQNDAFVALVEFSQNECSGGRMLSGKGFDIEKFIIGILNVIEKGLKFVQDHLIFNPVIVQEIGGTISLVIRGLFRKNHHKRDALLNATTFGVDLIGSQLNGTVHGVIGALDVIKEIIVPHIFGLVDDIKMIIAAVKQLIASLKKH